VSVRRIESAFEFGLARSDGVFVAACIDPDGCIRRLRFGVGDRPALEWIGHAYQDAMWGTPSADGDSLLLVGNVKGGYVSAAITLSGEGAALEFADRLPAPLLSDIPIAVFQPFGGELPQGMIGGLAPPGGGAARIDQFGRVYLVESPPSQARQPIVYAVRIDFADGSVRSVRVV
jgi:hypothetical protein